MPTELRRQHDGGRVTGIIVSSMDGTFILQALPEEARELGLTDHHAGTVEEAKTRCDDLVQMTHPHECSDERCGGWTQQQ